jgi:hypothetical protein
MIGAGKYDEEAMALLKALGAAGVVLLVAGGRKGEGFAVCTRGLPTLERLPAALLELSAAVDRDLQQLRGEVRSLPKPEPLEPEVTITLSLRPAVAAALARFCEKASFETAMSVLYPHKDRELRSSQAHEILVGCREVEDALLEQNIRGWPWVETGQP